MTDIHAIARHFAIAGELVTVSPSHAGHINDSYILTCRHPDGSRRYLLQRINQAVFPQPALVMANIQRVSAHLKKCLADAGRRTLTLVPTRAGSAFHRDDTGDCWRLYDFLEGTRSILSVETPEQAHAAGRAFGEFQALLADLPPPRLHETIPDFHNTPLRLAALERAIAEDRAGRVRDAGAEIDFALSRRALAPILVELQRSGAAPERVVHNDAKISNILFDAAGGEALCVVDLDTVMPGLSLFDFGDMVRSMTCRAAEDATDAATVGIDGELFAALAGGYLASAGAFLSDAELAHLVDAGKVITYEQGVRFLTDYLNGDAYYRTTRPGQNLDRTRTQLALLRSIERDEAKLQSMV